MSQSSTPDLRGSHVSSPWRLLNRARGISESASGSYSSSSSGSQWATDTDDPNSTAISFEKQDLKRILERMPTLSELSQVLEGKPKPKEADRLAVRRGFLQREMVPPLDWKRTTHMAEFPTEWNDIVVKGEDMILERWFNTVCVCLRLGCPSRTLEVPKCPVGWSSYTDDWPWACIWTDHWVW